MTDAETPAETPVAGRARRVLPWIAGAALFAAGWGTAALTGMLRPAVAMAPIRPVAASAQTVSDNIVSVKGKVTQMYDSNFTVADVTGRVLVQAGRRSRLFPLVTVGEEVTVQGRFVDGALRATYIVRPGGIIEVRGGGRRGERGGRQWPKQQVTPPAAAQPAAIPKET